MSSSLFQEMEEFTLFDGLVPSSGLSDFGLAVEDQLDAGILFPGDSLVKHEFKNEVGSEEMFTVKHDIGHEELFEDFLSTGSIEDPFSQEWMETVDLSSLLDETKPAAVEKIVSQKSEIKPAVIAEEIGSSNTTGSSRLLAELLTQPIKIKSSPTVTNDVQLNKSETDTSSVEIKIPESGIDSDAPSILEQALSQIDGIEALLISSDLQQALYNNSISSGDSIENTSNEVSLMDTSNEFLTASPLSTEDIDSILSGSEPASPSDSLQDDPDYFPSTSEVKKIKRSSKSQKGSNSRPAPYEKNVEKLDRKERKRIQNRNAAIRYREKKRAERGTIHSEEEELVIKNKELKTKVEHLSNEINYMKTLLTEICEARGLKIQFK